MGAVAGGAVGASVGLAGGAAIASLLVPAWEPCLQSDWAQRLRWDSAVPLREREPGDLSEHAVDVGVAKDDVHFYHDLLRQGRSLVIANVDSEEQSATARSAFKQQGSKDVDRARKKLGKAA